MNWEKLRSPAGATFKNLKMSLLIGKKLGVQPEGHSKNPNFEFMDELVKSMS